MSAKIEPIDMYGKAPEDFAYIMGERLNEVIDAINKINEAVVSNLQNVKDVQIKLHCDVCGTPLNADGDCLLRLAHINE